MRSLGLAAKCEKAPSAAILPVLKKEGANPHDRKNKNEAGFTPKVLPV
jgi:hypothetical protein